MRTFALTVATNASPMFLQRPDFFAWILGRFLNVFSARPTKILTLRRLLNKRTVDVNSKIERKTGTWLAEKAGETYRWQSAGHEQLSSRVSVPVDFVVDVWVESHRIAVFWRKRERRFSCPRNDVAREQLAAAAERQLRWRPWNCPAQDALRSEPARCNKWCPFPDCSCGSRCRPFRLPVRCLSCC